MKKYMSFHTFTPNSITTEQARQIARDGQQAKGFRGYRAYMNLAAGRGVCIVEADNPKAVSDFFGKAGVPTQSIVEVELEGERGTVHDLKAAASGA